MTSPTKTQTVGMRCYNIVSLSLAHLSRWNLARAEVLYDYTVASYLLQFLGKVVH